MTIKIFLQSSITIIKEKLRWLVHPIIYKENKKIFENRKSFYASFLHPNDKVFDVGANLGNRVEVFLSLKNSVIAIEPQLYCYNYLKLKYSKSITLLNIALGSKKDRMLMYINTKSSTISSLSIDFINKMKANRFKNQEWNERQEVTIDTLDNIITQYGEPKFIKIDVEGFEVEVLKGLSHKVKYICFEYSIPEQISNIFECLDLINKISPNYTYNFSLEETNSFVFETWKNYDDIRDTLKNKTVIFQNFGDIYAKLIVN